MTNNIKQDGGKETGNNPFKSLGQIYKFVFNSENKLIKKSIGHIFWKPNLVAFFYLLDYYMFEGFIGASVMWREAL